MRTVAAPQLVCAVEQHYVYRWDELNRLAEARRYDRDTSTAGVWQLQVRQRYRYDGSNQRTVKQTLDQDGCVEPPTSGTPCERIALYAYPGDFERRGLVRGLDAYEANATLGTETQYLVAGARVVWKHRTTTLGSGYEPENRLTVGIGDLIQTTSAVLDVRTGALLEASTYYPNGARETFLNDDDALTTPEVAGFTGKEGDEEVGVVYFGERYLIPRIGRWASPDPLHVHASGGGEALNSYHYVSGNLLAGRDPLGLAPGDPDSVVQTNQGPMTVSEPLNPGPGEADMNFTDPSQQGGQQAMMPGLGGPTPGMPPGQLPPSMLELPSGPSTSPPAQITPRLTPSPTPTPVAPIAGGSAVTLALGLLFGAVFVLTPGLSANELEGNRPGATQLCIESGRCNSRGQPLRASPGGEVEETEIDDLVDDIAPHAWDRHSDEAREEHDILDRDDFDDYIRQIISDENTDHVIRERDGVDTYYNERENFYIIHDREGEGSAFWPDDARDYVERDRRSQ